MSQVDDEALDRALRTVFGVVTARQLGNADDAAFVLDAYLREETANRPLPNAWALLFTAATGWIIALLTEEATRMNTTPMKRVNSWSARHARSLK